MIDHIDWTAIARQLGSLGGDSGEKGSTDLARQALEVIIGEDSLKQAVEHYISFEPGYELARSVLWHLRPWTAMQKCYEVYASNRPIDERRSAVELLRVVADTRAVGWITEFLENEDVGIQNWGAGVLDQLLWSSIVEEDDVRHLIDRCLNHENEYVSETGEFIVDYLAKREGISRAT